MTIQKPEVLDLDAFRWTVLQSDNTNFHYRVRSLLRENVPKSWLLHCLRANYLGKASYLVGRVMLVCGILHQR